MNIFRVVMVPTSLLSMRTVFSSTPAVGAARLSAGKLPWALTRLQQQGTGALQRQAGAHLAREHAVGSWQPGMVQPRAWGFNPANALALGATIGGIGYLCGGDGPDGATFALASAALLNMSILIHEAGHLAAARALGVAVHEFSVGIGPRVAWWQGPSTTYSLRALPLLGYVRFLNAAHVRSAGGGAAVAAQGVYGTYGAHAAAAQERLLETLSPGRRALVLVAGVAANVVLAAAFAAYQIISYGQIGGVVRPGVLILKADGWQGEDEGTEQQQQQQLGPRQSPQRLQAGDVVLSVGQWRIPTGGAVDRALVTALSAAAIEPPPPHGAAADCDAISPEGEHLALHGAVRSLDGVKMAVLRTRKNSGGLVPERSVIQLDAADMLKYESLSVVPNMRVGFRPPEGAWEAVRMTVKELISSTRAVVECWADIFGSATGSKSSSGGPQAETTGFVSNNSSTSSSSSGSGGHFVGPLGLVASAAEYMVELDRQTRLASSSTTSSSNTSSSSSHQGRLSPSQPAAAAESEFGGELASSSSSCLPSPSPSSDADGSGDSRNGGGDGRAFLDESLTQQPHPLLSLGILLNMQLALFNLLPVPVMDGGQLVMVAAEAVRGGRRLSTSLERTALLGSAVLMGCWAATIFVRDLVDLADKAAVRLAANAQPQYGTYGSWFSGLLQQSDRMAHGVATEQEVAPASVGAPGLSAAAAVGRSSDLRLRVQVTAGGGDFADSDLGAEAASAVVTGSLAL